MGKRNEIFVLFSPRKDDANDLVSLPLRTRPLTNYLMTSEIGLRVPSRTEALAAIASQNGGDTPKQTAVLFGVVFVFPDPIAKIKVSTCSFHLM